MKRIHLLVILSCLSLLTSARIRSEAEMQAIASQQLEAASVKAYHGMVSSSLLKVHNDPSFNVYAPADGAGYVIVGKDDAFPEVLGYSTGSFSYDDAPDGLKWWMSCVSATMRRADAHSIVDDALASYEPIKPMMTTKWAQNEPFNQKSPFMSFGKAPAGCVAIALAQVLNFNKHPQSVDFRGSYYLANEGIQRFDDVRETFSWDYQDAYGYYYPEGYTSDKDTIYADYTRKQAASISRLCYACALGVNMLFSFGGSGAFTMDAAPALIERFSYPATSVKYLPRKFYTNAEWHRIVHRELEHGYPVVYSGVDVTDGGHAFVAHGRDAQGRLYINWGWQGMNDGYYNMDLMNPSAESFSEEQGIILGIRLQQFDEDKLVSLFASERPCEYEYTHSAGQLKVTYPSYLVNYSSNEFRGKLSLVVEDQETGKRTVGNLLSEEAIDTIPPAMVLDNGYEYVVNIELEPNHTYRVFTASKDVREEKMVPVRNIGGPIYHTMVLDAKGQASFTEMTSIAPLKSVTNESLLTRVYDMQGREVLLSPTSTFAPKMIPGNGFFVVRQGELVKKILK